MDDKQQNQQSLILGRFVKQKLVQNEYRYSKYIIKDVFGGNRAYIKTQKQNEPKPTILHQAGYLQELQGYPGFPLMIWSGNYSSKEMGLISEKLSYNLQELMQAKSDKKFSIPTVCLIGLQIIKLVQTLHDKHTVLQNFAPEAFRLHNERIDQLVVSNLFFCKRFRSSKTNQHYDLRQVDYLDFFNHFMSFNKLSFFSTSRRDDIESFLYLLVYMAQGKLPWSHLSNQYRQDTRKEFLQCYSQLLMEKESKVRRQFFEGLPKEFFDIFQHVCSLTFQQKPNYSFIRYKLSKLLIKLEKEKQPLLDWIVYLPSMRKEGLKPEQISLSRYKDLRLQQKYYKPYESTIQIDHFTGLNFLQAEQFNSNRNSRVDKRRFYKQNKQCQLI